ncbi:MAG TPA: response regulator transcription factor [Candidatus Gastranaerophilales bacterium]|nr:response regulator transcription factor [Candidatus Gastranaerophilales bacterium]
MTEKIKLLMVEDHKLLRVGLKAIFEEYLNLEIVGEAEDGQEAVKLARELKPNIILMDIGLPVFSGIEATRRIKESNPDIKIIILTSHTDEKEVLEALAAGASAYAMKDIKTEHLVSVIQTVNQGAFWLDPAVARIVTQKKTILHSNNRPYTRATFKADHANLTEREFEVLKLVVDGKSNNEIADLLKISEHTAKAHVCNIIQKLVVDDRTQAAVKAIKEGIV